jgi:hypothetical protein
MTVPVKCTSYNCNWRGKRTYQDCDCYDMCYHTGYGYCPKCRGRVQSVAVLKRHAENDKAASDLIRKEQANAKQ